MGGSVSRGLIQAAYHGPLLDPLRDISQPGHPTSREEFTQYL